MSERQTHTIYLGDGKRMAVAVADQCKGSNPSLTIDAEGRGVIALVPQTIAPLRVELKLLKEGDSIADVQPTLAWEMTADSIDGEPPYWADGVRIHGIIPMAADWHESRIKAQFDGGLPLLTQNPIPREIPASKSDVLPDDKISVVTTSLVPGERIWGEHDYLLTDSVGTAHYYWKTLAMTGGIITGKQAHPDIEGAETYTVDANGLTYTNLLPTDYHDYDLGDWVYILTLSAVATITDREILTPLEIPNDIQLRVAPYSIANRGTLPSIKSYGVSDFTQWANMRILYGVIESINGDEPEDHSGKQNLATVLLTDSGNTITNVPIKYWCQHEDTSHAMHAFDPGDVVLVAYDGYRNDPSSFNCIIIGHAASIYPCTTTTTTTTATTTTTTSSTTTLPPDITTTSGTTTTVTTTAYPPPEEYTCYYTYTYYQRTPDPDVWLGDDGYYSELQVDSIAFPYGVACWIDSDSSGPYVYLGAGAATFKSIGKVGYMVDGLFAYISKEYFGVSNITSRVEAGRTYIRFKTTGYNQHFYRRDVVCKT